MTVDHSSHFHRTSTVNRYKEVFEQTKEFIDQRIAHDVLLLDDFCTEKGYSRRTVQRSLSWHMTSWSAMLFSRRMHKASKELLATEKTVDGIARSVGYRDESSFVSAFSLWCGTSPEMFRREGRLNEGRAQQ